jgi:hypothetical protein
VGKLITNHYFTISHLEETRGTLQSRLRATVPLVKTGDSLKNPTKVSNLGMELKVSKANSYVEWKKSDNISD